jgi:hypothetical protein
MRFNGEWTARINQSDYINTLQDIIENSGSFSTFKSNAGYYSVVGCDAMKDEAGYILSDIIKIKHKQLLGDLKKFRENDRIGSPPIYKTLLGNFSPNTLRYMLVLGELEEHFGSLNEKNIIEIGSAYGGQCFIISRRHEFKSYTLVDIPKSVEISKKYLFLLKATKNVIFEGTNQITSKESDLVISNFALTELDDIGWNFYFNNIISKTKNFYIITNIWDSIRYKSLFKKLSTLFQVTSYPEPELRKTGTGIWIGERR